MKQILQAINQPFCAKVVIPGSKSLTNRALLLAALSKGSSMLSGMLDSEDTHAFMQALIELGIVIEMDKSKQACIVQGVGKNFPNHTANIECAQAGTAARFLLAACANASGIYHFDASLQLKARPLAGLLKILVNQGAKVSPISTEQMPLTIEGVNGLVGGKIVIDAAQTGQYISALLMVAPFAKSPMQIEIVNSVSIPYIEMTRAMMAEFGVKVECKNKTNFTIPIPQYYQAQNYFIEADLSTASYFFAAAAITQSEVTIQAINLKSTKQADAAFLKVLEKMGCHIISTEQGLTVKGPKQLVGIDIDMRDFSDCFMTLAAMACFASSPTTIRHIAHTRFKESNRMQAMYNELTKLNIRVEMGQDWFTVFPSMPHAAVVDSHHDHRIAMAFAIIGLRIAGIQVDGAECVGKTCPKFFSMWHNMLKQI